MSAHETLNDGAPCVGCGLCCDGTLFARVGVTAQEALLLTEGGLALETLDDQLFVTQPCPMSECGSCTKYEDRFAACRSFRCSLLQMVDAGEIAPRDAADKVAMAKDLVATVIAADAQAGQWAYRQDFKQQSGAAFMSANPQERAAMGSKLVHIIALEVFLDKWFRGKK